MPQSRSRSGARLYRSPAALGGARRAFAWAGAALFLLAPMLAAEEVAQPRWGIAAGIRYADIPFAAADESRADLVPLLYYRGESGFLDGLEGGFVLARRDGWRLSAFGRYRFLDFPAFAVTEARRDSWDIGLQLRHPLAHAWCGRWELLTDGDGAVYLDAGMEAVLGDRYASLRPYAGVRLKSDDFNTRYFGLGREALDWGADLHVRIEGRAHVYRNLYLLGRIGASWLGAEARRSSLVEDATGLEVFAGVGLFDEPADRAQAPRGARPYLRVAHGWATGSSLGDIVLGDIEGDPEDNRLTSLFYGHPLADALFGWPLAIYLTPGLAYHHASSVQGRSLEYVVALKAYYTARWPVRVRVGLAEGLSYVTQVPHLEQRDLERKGYAPSKFLNYLGLSIDVNAGDLLGLPAARGVWVGVGVHHRSGIFETGSQFGHIRGGSNYSTLYLQWHY